MKSVDLTSVPLFLNDTLVVGENNIQYHNWTYYGALPAQVGSEAYIIVNVVLYLYFFIFFIINIYLFTFLIIFYNSLCSFILCIYYNATTVQFANTTVDVEAQTTKYTLSIRGWDFKSLRNTLGVKFDTQSNSDTCVRSQEDQDGNVQWIKVILPNGNALYLSKFILLDCIFYRFNYIIYVIIGIIIFDIKKRYAKFMQQVQLDGRNVFGTIKSDESAVELRVPHFWEELIFDPNFSLLVTDLATNDEGCFRDNGKTFGVDNLTIILAVVLGSFGVFIFIVLVSFIIFFNFYNL